jgi:hypothetical protein
VFTTVFTTGIDSALPNLVALPIPTAGPP